MKSSSSSSSPAAAAATRAADILVNETRVFSVHTKNGTSLNGTAKSRVVFKVPGFVLSSNDVRSIGVRVQSAVIPNVFYNIQEQNIRLAYSSETRPELINCILWVSPGFYDVYSFTSHLNHLLQTCGEEQDGVIDGIAFGAFFKFSFDLNLNKVQMTSTDTGEGFFYVFPATCFEQLGIYAKDATVLDPSPVTIIGPFGTPINASYMPNLLSTCTLIASSPQLSTLNYATETGSSFFAAIPVTGDFGDHTYYQASTDSSCQLPVHTQLDTIEIVLQDQDGNYCDFQNTDWKIVFEITYSQSSTPAYETLTDAVERMMLEAVQDYEVAKHETQTTEILPINQLLEFNRDTTSTEMIL